MPISLLLSFRGNLFSISCSEFWTFFVNANVKSYCFRVVLGTLFVVFCKSSAILCNFCEVPNVWTFYLIILTILKRKSMYSSLWFVLEYLHIDSSKDFKRFQVISGRKLVFSTDWKNTRPLSVALLRKII